MTTGKSTNVTVEGVFVHETQKAWLIDFGKDKPVWLPKSMCELDLENPLPGNEVVVELPEHTAIDKGIV